MAGLLDDLLALFFGKGASVSFNLGSGYDHMATKEEKREKLKAACDEAMDAPELQPREGLTFCNRGTRRIALAVGCEDFTESMTANKQVAHVEANWRKVGAEEAQAHADAGGLAVAAKDYPVHGHIAVVYPTGSCGYSASWAKKVPWVANCGKRNAVMQSSQAFPVAEGEPGYYLWEA